VRCHRHIHLVVDYDHNIQKKIWVKMDVSKSRAKASGNSGEDFKKDGMAKMDKGLQSKLIEEEMKMVREAQEVNENQNPSSLYFI
jgi:hypothetical protein